VSRAAHAVRSASWNSAGRFPEGRGVIEGFQRARILSAILELTLERGASGVSVAHVVSRAGVSRRTFYEIFTDREDCFLAAFEDALERVTAVVAPAYERKGSWRERIRAGLVELLGFFDEDRGLGRFVVVESLAGGPRALELRSKILSRLTGVVEEGRVQGSAGSEPRALTAEGVVGAVGSILYARLSEADGEPLVELRGPLMSMIVLPYLGKAAAAKELARPAPAVRTVVEHAGAVYPLGELGMRLTYRTLRVLDAVAANPGASNRSVGETAGISDQGQISKLLARLKRLRLIENLAGLPGAGAPNAWRLTEKGQSIHRTIQTPKDETPRRARSHNHSTAISRRRQVK
jgi:AcrR family transcriptional regulator